MTTKKEVESEFRKYVKPDVDALYGRGDKVALRKAWNDYIDTLCKDGKITLKQYKTWDNPF